MEYIDKQATIDAIAKKAKEELADVNHYFREGVQLAVDVVEGMTEPKETENGSMPCPDARNSHDRTTDDCISRKVAIDAVKKCRNESDMPDMWNDGMSCALRCLYKLPSAQRERKRGRWIPNIYPDVGDGYRCSQCGAYHVVQYKFCHNCGADMRGGQNG